MRPMLPLIGQSLTASQLRKRVITQLAILAVDNGKVPPKVVKKP